MTTLGYAILGMLARERLSGYDVARQLRAPVGYFWQARHSQIYPELARLEAAGLLSHEVVAQRDRPAKKVYAITAAGAEALRAWVTEPVEEQPSVREELVVKAYSVWLADPAAAARLFRDQQRRHAERLALYRSYEARIQSACGSAMERVDSPCFALYATLRRGIGHERDSAAWCAWMADALERARPAQPAGPCQA